MRSRKLLKAESSEFESNHHHHHHHTENAALTEKKITIEASNFNGINQQTFNSTKNPSTPIESDDNDGHNYASSFHVDYNEPKTHPPKNN